MKLPGLVMVAEMRIIFAVRGRVILLLDLLDSLVGPWVARFASCVVWLGWRFVLIIGPHGDT